MGARTADTGAPFGVEAPGGAGLGGRSCQATSVQAPGRTFRSKPPASLVVRKVARLLPSPVVTLPVTVAVIGVVARPGLNETFWPAVKSVMMLSVDGGGLPPAWGLVAHRGGAARGLGPAVVRAGVGFRGGDRDAHGSEPQHVEDADNGEDDERPARQGQGEDRAHQAAAFRRSAAALASPCRAASRLRRVGDALPFFQRNQVAR